MPCWRKRHGRPLVLHGQRGVCNVISLERVQQTGFKELNNAAAGGTGGQCLDSQQARSSQTPPPPPPKSHREPAVLLDEWTCPCQCIMKSKPIRGLTTHCRSYWWLRHILNKDYSRNMCFYSFTVIWIQIIMGLVTWHPKDTNHAQNTENFFGERVAQNTEANPIDNRVKQCKLLPDKLPI